MGTAAAEHGYRVKYAFASRLVNELAEAADERQLAGQLRPLIDKTFPFDQTIEALPYVQQGHANGKVVITLD